MAQLDASLIGGYKPIDIPDPVNQLAKYLQLSGLQQQNQSGALQLQQAQQSAQETNALRRYLSDPANQGQDPNAMRAGIQRVAPIAGQPILKGMLDTQKTQGEIQGTTLGNADKSRTAVGSLAGSLATTKPDLNPTDIARFAQEAGKMGVTVDPQDFAKAMKPDGTFDADAARQVLLSYQSRGMTPDQQMTAGRPGVIESPTGPVAYNKSNPTAGFTVMQPTGMAGSSVPATPASQSVNQPFVGRQPAGNFAGDPATIYAGLQRIQDPNDRAAAVRAFQNQLAGANPTPDALGIFQGTGAQGPVSVAGAAPQGLTAAAPVAQTPAQAPAPALSPFMKFETKTDPMTGRLVNVSTTPGPDGNFVVKPISSDGLNGGKLSSTDQAMADKIAAYDLAPPSSMALHNPRMANIMAAVSEQNPSYDATQYQAKQAALKAFSTGKEGSALRSFSVAVDHLNSLSQLTDALNNGNIPLINKLANIVAANTGSTAPTTFDAAKEIVGKEVIKAIVAGGGGVDERARISELLSNAKTPAQLKAIIGEYTTLMGAQRDGLIAQYQNTTGRTDAATRFDFSKKGATPPPADQSTINALLQKYGN